MMFNLFKNKENKEKKPNKIFSFPIHTVFMIVGPSGCGKSYFCENNLLPYLLGESFKLEESGHEGFNIKYISSDDIRRELLGDFTAHKMDNKMMYVSEQAFDLLFNRLKNYMQYPTSSDFIVLDTTGLSDDFREKVQEICKENQYNLAALVFNFKDRKDFFKNFSYDDEFSFLNKSVTSRHIKKLKESALKTITKSRYGNLILDIDNPDFDQIGFEIEGVDKFKKSQLSSEKTYVTFGDLHGCINPLKELVRCCGFEIITNGSDEMMNPVDEYAKNTIFISVGDLVDKGPSTLEVIKFIHYNQKWFKLVLGNHENFVYKFLKGQITEKSLGDSSVMSYFDSINLFKENKKECEIFFELVENSSHFYKHKDFVVTHAPCKDKYIGKFDAISERNQRMISYPKKEKDMSDEEYTKKLEEFLHFIKEDSRKNMPFHLFGHISVNQLMRVKNKINLDLGCVYGNYLLGVEVAKNRKLFYKKIKTELPKNVESKKLPVIFGSNPVFDINLDELSHEELSRIHWAGVHKVNFISGTMAPSDAMDDSIESLEKGLDYYKNRGVDRVILQPKYMGSRCNVYLHRQLDKCYSTTRRGYLIKSDINMTQAYIDLQKRFFYVYPNAEYIIIDSEILPWRAIGSSLIDNEFYSYKEAVEGEISFLKENNFSESLKYLEKSCNDTDFVSDLNTLSKKEIISKYGDANYRTFKNFIEFKSIFIPLSDQESGLHMFERELNIFAKEDKVHLKPFAILKIVNKDGTEKLFFDESNEEMFRIVSNDKHLVINFYEEDGFEDAYTKAIHFFEDLTINQDMEGVVIKPADKVYIKGVAPFIKVRSLDYLHLVYGHDYLYPVKYKKLLNRKNTRKKLEVSIREFEVGKKMLEIPYKDISPENKEYSNLVANMIFEEKKEEELDPRL